MALKHETKSHVGHPIQKSCFKLFSMAFREVAEDRSDVEEAGV